MLLLSYFDRIIGPKIILTYPENLRDELDNEAIKQIRGLLDSADDGFFTHHFSVDLKTANWIFNLDSSWARGRMELGMLSILLSEEEPDYSFYEKKLSKFVGNIRQIPDIFKAFYIKMGPKEEKENIKKNFEILKEELHNLYKILSLKKIETEGQLISFSKLKESREIRLSSEIIERIGSITTEKQNCFIVFRTQGDAIKLDVIPVKTERIIRLAIIFAEQIQLPILHKISQIITNFGDKLSLIFTSGLCQEAEKCIYEVYIDTDLDTLNHIIEEIYKITNILEIEVKLIGLT